MADVILISKKYLDEKSIINTSTDYNFILPVARQAQFTKIRPLLGSDLYDQIISQVDAGTLSTENKKLLDDFILPALMWYVTSDCLVILKFRITNTGVIEKSPENGSQADADSVKLAEQRFGNIAENYGNEITKYLVANTTLYPLAFTSYGIGKTQRNKSAFNAGGLFLDNCPEMGIYDYNRYKIYDYYYYNS